MVAIPAGSFMMGSAPEEQVNKTDEKPRHEVQVNAFALGKYEVTRQQFAVFIDETGYSPGNSCFTLESGEFEDRSGRNWQTPGFDQASNHPVVCVNLGDAQAYIRWLNQKTGERYRLPTEAEWEYSARAGTETRRYWGDDPAYACSYANVGDQTEAAQLDLDKSKMHSCSDGYVYTSPVGSFQANAFGLYDMLGNVWEWTCSAYTESGYDGSEKTCINDTKSRRLYRGGSWNNGPVPTRSAHRDGSVASHRRHTLGFRVAQDR